MGVRTNLALLDDPLAAWSKHEADVWGACPPHVDVVNQGHRVRAAAPGSHLHSLHPHDLNIINTHNQEFFGLES